MTTPSLLAQDEGVRFYDPATGQFLTRDPAETITREPYGYVGGNPLNMTDPTGLCWGPICTPGEYAQGARDLLGVCSDAVDPSCTSVAEANPAMAQGIVDFSSGVLSFNLITAATNAAGWTDTGQYANTCSGWYYGGQATMFAIDVAAGGGLWRNTQRTVEGRATAWGTKDTVLDLKPDRWVMPGERTPGNFFKTTTWSNIAPASYSNSITGTVRYAWDGGVSGFLRGLLGHRVVVP
jgi:hypothetical protein